MEETTLQNKCKILADLWLNYREDEEFKDFISYNDLGLPLSFLLANNVVKETESAIIIIDETFNLFLAGLEMEDSGFESLDELLDFD